MHVLTLGTSELQPSHRLIPPQHFYLGLDFPVTKGVLSLQCAALGLQVENH